MSKRTEQLAVLAAARKAKGGDAPTRSPKGSARRQGRQSRRQVDAERRATGDLAPLDDSTADLLARFLHAGVHCAEALKYLRPGITDETIREELAAKWIGTTVLLDAVERLNGGAWPDLPADRRLEIALDRHYAELAYFLLTHNYTEADGLDYKKVVDARTAIALRIAGQEGKGDAFDEFMRAIQDGKVQMMIPPQLREERERTPASAPGILPPGLRES